MRDDPLRPGDMVIRGFSTNPTLMYWPESINRFTSKGFGEREVGSLSYRELGLVLATGIQPDPHWAAVCLVLAPSGAVGYIVIDCVRRLGAR